MTRVTPGADQAVLLAWRCSYDERTVPSRVTTPAWAVTVMCLPLELSVAHERGADCGLEVGRRNGGFDRDGVVDAGNPFEVAHRPLCGFTLMPGDGTRQGDEVIMDDGLHRVG